MKDESDSSISKLQLAKEKKSLGNTALHLVAGFLGVTDPTQSPATLSAEVKRRFREHDERLAVGHSRSRHHCTQTNEKIH